MTKFVRDDKRLHWVWLLTAATGQIISMITGLVVWAAYGGRAVLAVVVATFGGGIWGLALGHARKWPG